MNYEVKLFSAAPVAFVIIDILKLILIREPFGGMQVTLLHQSMKDLDSKLDKRYLIYASLQK